MCVCMCCIVVCNPFLSRKGSKPQINSLLINLTRISSQSETHTHTQILCVCVCVRRQVCSVCLFKSLMNEHTHTQSVWGGWGRYKGLVIKLISLIIFDPLSFCSPPPCPASFLWRSLRSSAGPHVSVQHVDSVDCVGAPEPRSGSKTAAGRQNVMTEQLLWHQNQNQKSFNVPQTGKFVCHSSDRILQQKHVTRTGTIVKISNTIYMI